jgi:hypothetical protein
MPRFGLPFFFVLGWMLTPFIINLATITRLPLGVRVAYLIWSLVVANLHYFLVRSDPGRLHPRTPLSILLCQPNHKLCFECRLQIPLRGRHCHLCGKCVKVFDHHCPWVANCIGAGNLLLFHVYLLALLGYVFFSVGMAIGMLAGGHSERGQPWADWVTLCFGSAGLPLLALVVYQLDTACRAQTTYERLTRPANTQPSPSPSNYLGMLGNHKQALYDSP